MTRTRRGRAREGEKVRGGEEKGVSQTLPPCKETDVSTPGPHVVTVNVQEGDDVELRTAEAVTGPYIPNAIALASFARGTIGTVYLDKLTLAMSEGAKRVQAGDMSAVEAMLITQATTLNALFADLTRRASNNLGNGHTFEAGEQLFKMALRAQSQCRATLETLATVKNPPVVFARQANIANGPQQVNNTLNATSHAREKPTAPNELLEADHE